MFIEQRIFFCICKVTTEIFKNLQQALSKTLHFIKDVKTFSQVQKLLPVSVNLNRTERWPENRVLEMLDLTTCQQIGKREDTML
jgi:hypothetical protein